jgi:hypothetical protein
MNCIHPPSIGITCSNCVTKENKVNDNETYNGQELSPDMIDNLRKTGVLQMARQIYIETIVPAVVQMGGLPKDADACAKIAITAAEIWRKEQEKYFKGETDGTADDTN